MLLLALLRGPSAPLLRVANQHGFSFALQTSSKPSSASDGAWTVQKGRPEAEKSGIYKWQIGHGSLSWLPSWHLSQLAAVRGKQTNDPQLRKTTNPDGDA